RIFSSTVRYRRGATRRPSVSTADIAVDVSTLFLCGHMGCVCPLEPTVDCLETLNHGPQPHAYVRFGALPNHDGPVAHHQLSECCPKEQMSITESTGQWRGLQCEFG